MSQPPNSNSPLDLHPQQHVWYMAPTGNIVTGIVWNHRPQYGLHREARYEIRVIRGGRPCGVKIIPASWIRRGEIARCRQEEARARREADTDEWALLGARDWAAERKVLEGK